MGLIKVNGEIIKDRRVNGARIKLDTGDWIKVASVLIALILLFGKMQWTVAENSKETEKQKEQMDINTQRLTKLETEFSNIKESLIYIRGKLDTLVLNIKND